MKKTSSILSALALVTGAIIVPAAPALADSQSDMSCGMNNGKAATGEPIKVGGINGRPVQYIVENDQWNPELAGQVGTKLVKDEGVVALVGNGSVVSMAVNAKLYADEGVMAMASACAISDCYENSNIVSTNQGPLPSGIGALKFAIEELGSTHAACIGFNIPNNGGWACDWMNKYMESKGLKGTSILMDPTAVDLNSVYLQALAEGVDTILLMLPAGPAIGLLKVAEEQGGREQFKWVSQPRFMNRVLAKFWATLEWSSLCEHRAFPI